MTTNANFQRDLIIGQLFENKAQKRLIEYLNNKARVIEICFDYRYDFKTSHNMKYECKLNRKAFLTNTIFIEFESFKKPSGISKTEADYYIIIILKPSSKDMYLLISTYELEQLIKEKQYKRIFKDHLKSGYIFDIHTILKLSVDINEFYEEINDTNTSLDELT